MKFTDLARVAQHNDSKPFKEGLKSFSVRFDSHLNGKRSNMIETFRKEVLNAFTKVHDKNCCACNVKLEIVLHTPDTMFDFSNFGPTQRSLHESVSYMGMKLPGFTVRHEKSDGETFVEVVGTFRDVSPLDLYRTEPIFHD